MGDNIKEKGRSHVPSQNTGKKYTLIAPGKIPLAIFHVSDAGPTVLMRDFGGLPNTDLDEFIMDEHLQQMALGYISALGMGHAYEEGCFDLPVSGTSEYRTLLMCFKLLNPGAKDSRLMIGYYQFAFMVPRAIAKLLPSPAVFEITVINLIKSMLRSSENLTPEMVAEVKVRVLNSILSHLRKKEVERVIDDIL